MSILILGIKTLDVDQGLFNENLIFSAHYDNCFYHFSFVGYTGLLAIQRIALLVVILYFANGILMTMGN